MKKTNFIILVLISVVGTYAIPQFKGQVGIKDKTEATVTKEKHVKCRYAINYEVGGLLRDVEDTIGLSDTSIDLKSIKINGYYFLKWAFIPKGAAEIEDSLKDTTTIKLFGDVTIKGSYAGYYNVKFWKAGNGKIIPEGVIQLRHNETIKITAVPDSGYIFDQWITDTSAVTISNVKRKKTQISIENPTFESTNLNVVGIFKKKD